MASPGLVKLNIKAKGSATAIEANVRNATRAPGISYGIMAQRSVFSAGIVRKAKLGYSDSIEAMRNALNSKITYNNYNVPRNYNVGMYDNSTNKFMTAMMAMNMIGEMGSDIIQGIKDLKSTGSSSETKEFEYKNWDSSKFEQTKALKSADSFDKIQSIETKANNTIQNLSNDYQKIGTDAKNQLSELLQSNNDDYDIQTILSSCSTDKITLSKISVDENDLSTFDTACDTIDKDLANVANFASQDIPAITGKFEQEIGQVTTNINFLQSEIDKAKAHQQDTKQLEQKLGDANNKKQKLEQAKKDFSKGAQEIVTDLKKSLQDKKNELGDIKQVKAKIADKKYDLAKEQDSKVKSNNKKFKELEEQIKFYEKQYGSENKDNTIYQLLNSQIKKYNELIDATKKLVNSLQTYTQTNGTTVKNGKGRSYTISNADYPVPDKMEKGEDT